MSNVGNGPSTYVLTGNGTSAPPTWQAAPSGAGIVTIDGDTGSITGTTVSIVTDVAAINSGSSVLFSNTDSTSTLNVSDVNNNTMVGQDCGNLTITGNQNTAFGVFAGSMLSTDQYCTLIGYGAGYMLNGSVENTLIGRSAAQGMITGSFNAIIGSETAGGLLSGSNNSIFGYNSGVDYIIGTESSNILISNAGVAAENNVIRIGTQGTDPGEQNTCFIAGITGKTVTGSAILCDSNGQLGTIVSSERYKENIIDVQDSTSILALNPVEFNYKKDVNKSRTFGLIAEEVHEKFPDLCIYKDGLPETIKYHEMPALLLKEIQRLNKRIESLEALNKPA